MATSAVGERRHVCDACGQCPRDQPLKVLPCSHIFCVTCLSKHAVSTTSSTDRGARVPGSPSDADSVDVAGDGDSLLTVFACPSCHCAFTMSKGDLTPTQNGEHEASPRLVDCDLCEEGQARSATHICDKCQKKMCRACRRLHDLVSDKHVHRVRSMGPGDHQDVGRQPCPHHPDQVLCFHCRKCDVSICLHCKLTFHEGHVTEDMTAAARRAREELTGLVDKANKQINIIEASLGSLERDKAELFRQKQEQTRDVTARCEALISWATRARDEVIDGLTKIERALASSFRAEERVSRATIDTLSGLVDLAACVSGYGPDVVLLKNELKMALLNDEQLHIHRQGAAQDNRRCFFPCRSDPSVVELDMVRVYMGQFHEDDDDESVASSSPKQPTPTLKSLAHNVSEMMKCVQSNCKTLTKMKVQMAGLEKTASELDEQVKSALRESRVLQEDVKAVTELRSKVSSTEIAISALREETKSLWTETGTMKDALLMRGRMNGYF